MRAFIIAALLASSSAAHAADPQPRVVPHATPVEAAPTPEQAAAANALPAPAPTCTPKPAPPTVGTIVGWVLAGVTEIATLAVTLAQSYPAK